MYVDDIKLAGQKQNIDPMWKVRNKEVDLGEPTSFLDHENLVCTQRQCEISTDFVDNHRTMFESRINAGATGKFTMLGKSAYFLVVLRHGRSCQEMRGPYCELAIKKIQQLCNASTQCIDDHHFQEEELKSGGELSKVCSQINAKIWHVLDDLTFYCQ